MKRLNNILFNAAMTFVAAMFAISACTPAEQEVEPNVEVSQNSFTSEAAGESFEVTVTSNVAWTAEVENQDKWVTVDPSTGQAGDTKVTLVVKKNNGDNARETKVTFKGETASATVAVNQFGKDKISIDKNTYTATPAGGSDVVKVTTNNNWTATVSEDAAWVTVAPASGQAGEADATITVAENTAAEARTAKVTFAAGDAKIEYTVSQEGVSVSLAQTSYSVEAEGGNTNVAVTANVAWTAAASAEWVTVAPASGNSGATEVTVTVSENPVEEARTATVTFTANENVSVVYTVSQAAKKPVVLNNQYAYTAAGAEVIPVDINSKFVEFGGGAAAIVLSSVAGVNNLEAAAECDEYVVCSIAEAVIANIQSTAETTVDLKTIADGSVAMSLVKNGKPVFEYTGAASIKSGVATFKVSATAVVIDVEMVMADDSEFRANTTFAPEAFVKPTGSVSIAVSNITATQAHVVCTPDPQVGFTYYSDYLPKELADVMMPTDQDKITYLINALNEVLTQYNMTWSDLIVEGVDEYTFTDLDPLTEYYAVAFGVDAQGNVTTGLFKEVFATKDLNPALKEWIGTWNLVSSDTYGPEGLTGKPSERTITISTESVFDVILGEDDLVVAGLSYTDGYPLYTYSASGETIPMEAVGTVSSKGELKLKNECEILEYGANGMITWYGHITMDSQLYYVSGSYNPYTLAFGSDKTTATGTPAKLQLQSADGEYVVTYYDIKFVASDGVRSLPPKAEYGAISGTWTLTKVPEAPAAALQSVGMKPIQTKLERKMEIQKNNLMKNLNSSYLYKAAQIR